MKSYKLLVFILFSLFFLPASGQEKTDSLIEVFEHAKGGKRLAIANEAFRHLDELQVTDSLLQFGNITPPDTIAVWLYYWAAEAKLENHDFVHATTYLKKACALVSPHDPSMVSDCYNELAICYARQGLFPQGIEASQHAIDADEQQGDKARLMVSLNTIAAIYLMSKQFDEGERLVQQSLQLATELNDSIKMAVRLGLLSEIESNRGNLEKALGYAQEALRLDSLRGDTMRMAIRWVQTASTLYTMERYTEARRLLLEAEPVLKHTGNLTSLAICLNQLGHVYLKEELWDQAAESLKQALDIYAQTGERYSQTKAHYGLWKALRRGQTNEADSHLEAYILLKDSLYDEEVARMTSDFEARYQTAQLERQSEEARQRSRLMLIGGSVGLTLLLMLVILLIYTMRMKMRAAHMQMQLLHEQIRQMEDIITESNTTDTSQQESESQNATEAVREVDRQFKSRLTAAVKKGLATRNYNANILAQDMAMSYSQLNRRMQDLVGTSPAVFIMQFRLEKAKQLLASTDIPIGYIATQCGFEDHSYFTRAFKQAYGETPKEYRQQHFSLEK